MRLFGHGLFDHVDYNAKFSKQQVHKLLKNLRARSFIWNKLRTDDRKVFDSTEQNVDISLCFRVISK